MVARRGPGCPLKVCVYSHPAHPAMEMQDTFHCLLGASSSGYTTHKVLKRMLPLGVSNQSEMALLLPIKCQRHHFKIPSAQTEHVEDCGTRT
jgi:hypothetical protein